MTELKKVLKRSIPITGRLVLIFEIYPNGMMYFHERRCRKRYGLPIVEAFRQAVLADKAGDRRKRRTR